MGLSLDKKSGESQLSPRLGDTSESLPPSHEAVLSRAQPSLIQLHRDTSQSSSRPCTINPQTLVSPLDYVPAPPALRILVPETTKPGLMRRFELLGDLATRVHEALKLDAREQGVVVPLPELKEVELRRAWQLFRGRRLGYAIVGSCVGYLQTSIVSWLWESRTANHRAKRAVQEYLIAVHELTHCVGAVFLVASNHLSKGFPIKTRAGLLLLQPVVRSALFHSLEEVNACLTELRVAKRHGLVEVRDTKIISAMGSIPFLSWKERQRLVSLLKEFSIGKRAFIWDRTVEIRIPGLVDPAGTKYAACGGQLELVGGIETIVHSVIGLERPERSLAAFSKLLSCAHAGDFSAYKKALSILRQAVGPEGVRILSLVWSLVKDNTNLVPFVAETTTLSKADRARFLKLLHQLMTGELMLTEALHDGRVPTIHQVHNYLSRSDRWEGNVRNWLDLLRCRERVLPERLTRLAFAASAGALARGERLKAYRILLNSHQPVSSWPPEIALEVAKVSPLLRLLMNSWRCGLLVSEFLVSKLRR